jgi:hypothetical protein
MGGSSLDVISKLENSKAQDQDISFSQVATGNVELALPFGMDPESLKAKTVKGPVQCASTVAFSPAPGRIVKSEGVVDMKFTMQEFATAGNPGESTVKIKYKIDLLP